MSIRHSHSWTHRGPLRFCHCGLTQQWTRRRGKLSGYWRTIKKRGRVISPRKTVTITADRHGTVSFNNGQYSRQLTRRELLSGTVRITPADIKRLYPKEGQ